VAAPAASTGNARHFMWPDGIWVTGSPVAEYPIGCARVRGIARRYNWPAWLIRRFMSLYRHHSVS